MMCSKAECQYEALGSTHGCWVKLGIDCRRQPATFGPKCRASPERGLGIPCFRLNSTPVAICQVFFFVQGSFFLTYLFSPTAESYGVFTPQIGLFGVCFSFQGEGSRGPRPVGSPRKRQIPVTRIPGLSGKEIGGLGH